MAYHETFISSGFEEKKRRDLLNGSRRFYFLGREFYFSYSPEIVRGKEEMIQCLYKIGTILNNLGRQIKNEYENSCLKEEIESSCLLDGYTYSRKFESLYLSNKEIPLVKRNRPIKNLSLEVGFASSSPCKNENDISEGLLSLQSLKNEWLNEDILIDVLIEHFLFEYIHPYETMNGLIGRLNIFKALQETSYNFLGLRFSFSFQEKPKDYFLAFKRSERSYCLNEYLEAVLIVLKTEIEKDLQDLKEKERRWKLGLKQLESLNLKTGEYETVKGILMMKIFRKQKLNLTRLAAVLGKSPRTIFRHVARLESINFDTPK